MPNERTTRYRAATGPGGAFDRPPLPLSPAAARVLRAWLCGLRCCPLGPHREIARRELDAGPSRTSPITEAGPADQGCRRSPGRDRIWPEARRPQAKRTRGKFFPSWLRAAARGQNAMFPGTLRTRRSSATGRRAANSGTDEAHRREFECLQRSASTTWKRFPYRGKSPCCRYRLTAIGDSWHRNTAAERKPWSTAPDCAERRGRLGAR